MGNSPGRAPRRMRSTHTAVRWNRKRPIGEKLARLREKPRQVYGRQAMAGRQLDDQRPLAAPGEDLADQCEPLAAQLRSEAGHSSHTATGPGEVRHEADADDVR